MPTQPDQPIVVQMSLLGWTVDDLARESGFHERTIRNWTYRRRRPSLSQLQKLARVFGCDLADLADADAPIVQTPTNPERRPWGATTSPTSDAAERWKQAKGDA